MSSKIPSVAIIAALILVAFQLIMVPTPAQALRYGVHKSLGAIDASYYGENGGDGEYFSRMVANIGDINGDGYDDFAMSAIWDDNGGTHAGKVYIFFGAPTGWKMDVNSSKANGSFIAEGAGDAGDNGHGLCGGGDVNGDGLDDIVIGMPMNDDHGTDSGQVYIIFGHRGTWSQNVKLSNANASYYGEHAGDWAGRWVGCGGDVNGDGLSDIVVGADSNGENGALAGEAYVIFGKKSGWTMDTNLNKADASFLGEAAGDAAGISVAIVGDVNGDHYDDFLIGAANNNRGGSLAGAAYLILGKSSGWMSDVKLSNADSFWRGENAGDSLGYMVAKAGDVNGDGLDDLLIGAYRNNEGGTDAGEAYLIFGKKAGWGLNVSIQTGCDASWLGEATVDYLGRGLSGGGDVNGDGYDDIVLGAPQNDWVATDAGQAYLILGKASGWTKDTAVLSAASSTFVGEVAGDLAGRTESNDGDFNGDGLADILVSAHFNSEFNYHAGQGYVVFPDVNKVPTVINAVKAFDKSYVKELSIAQVNDTVYVQLNGTDADALKANIALVNVASNKSAPRGFRISLVETGLNTGIFHGNFTLKNRTSEAYRWLNASDGEVVTISSVTDPTKNSTIFIGHLQLRPVDDDQSATEDVLYSVKYWTVNGPASTWTFNTNASWLKFNATTHVISGIPNNGDVGKYHVRINVTNAWGSTDEHSFNLIVWNVAPIILTNDVLTVKQDQHYAVDFNSSDDGQGKITWHLATNATWLKIDQVTGNLTGTPHNNNTGKYWVNVSVDDGNGGWAWRNFTLTVIDVNDPPVITTKDVVSVYERQNYYVRYNVTDIDKVLEVMTWSLDTNASWLHLDTSPVALNGTPVEQDVGKYFVNISVSDGRGMSDFHKFNLTVINVNEPPVITSIPGVTATVGQLYTYHAMATDTDKGDVLEFSLGTHPKNLSVNKTTGLVQWTPTLDQNGTQPVVLRVSDGLVTVEQSFNITVRVPSADKPPVANLLSPTDKAALDITNPGLSWSGTDDDNDPIEYDVFLGLDQAKVAMMDGSMRRASRIPVTTYQAPELQKGSTYYWTVLPYDHTGPGDCPSGVWSFNISDTAIANNPPVITSTPVTKATVGKQYRYDVHATDKDAGDTLTYILEKGPKTMTIDKKSGTITWIPAPADVGNVPVTVSVTDGKAFAKQSFTIVVTKEVVTENKPPVLDLITQQTATVGQPFSYIVKAHDPDQWDATNLTFSLNKTPAGMTIDPKTGEIRWTPTKAQLGDNTIVITVTDTKSPVNNSFIIVVKDVTNPPGPKNNDQWAGVLPWLLALIIIIVCVVLIVIFVAMRRRKAKQEAALRKASKPRRAHDTRLASTSPHSDEPILSAIPVDETPVTKPDHVPDDEKDTTISKSVNIGRRSYSKTEIMEVLKVLPHELPVFLLLKSRENASEEVLKAEYKKNKDGHVILNLAGEWFHGDPKYLTKYLTPFVEEPEVAAGAPETKQAASAIESTTAEAEQRSVADEVIAKLDTKEKAGPPKNVKIVKKKVKSAVSESELKDSHDDKSEKPPEEKKAEEYTDIDSIVKDLELK